MTWHRRWLGVLVCASFTLSSACAATIDRKSGPRIVGRIDRSDENQLFVTTPADDRYTVERSDIVAIDHPGKLSMWLGAGGLLAGAGLTALGLHAASGTENCTTNCPSGFVGIVGAMGIVMILESLPFLIGGYRVYSRSVAAAAMPPLRVPMQPSLPTLPPPGAGMAAP
jgi:hypothetical protein